MDLDKLRKKVNKMGAAEKYNSEEWAESSITYLCDILRINQTILAGFLNVTERTVENWKTKKNIDICIGQNKGRRLLKFEEIVTKSISAGLTPVQIMNMLNEPIVQAGQDDEDTFTLLYFIAFDPENKLLSGQVDMMIKKYKDEK